MQGLRKGISNAGVLSQLLQRARMQIPRQKHRQKNGTDLRQSIVYSLLS